MKREKILFIRKLLKNPKSIGAIAPSSKNLALFIARHIKAEDTVVELGAGTGGLTRALLEAGVDPSHLILVEMDHDMCALLRRKFPQLTVIEGDASHLPQLLLEEAPHVTKVDAIVSGIPMVNLNFQEQSHIMKGCFDVLHDHGQFLQFTYGPVSPLPSKKLGLQAKRLGHVLKNMPPAVIWQYTRTHSVEAVLL